MIYTIINVSSRIYDFQGDEIIVGKRGEYNRKVATKKTPFQVSFYKNIKLLSGIMPSLFKNFHKQTSNDSVENNCKADCLQVQSLKSKECDILTVFYILCIYYIICDQSCKVLFNLFFISFISSGRIFVINFPILDLDTHLISSHCTAES